MEKRRQIKSQIIKIIVSLLYITVLAGVYFAAREITSKHFDTLVTYLFSFVMIYISYKSFLELFKIWFNKKEDGKEKKEKHDNQDGGGKPTGTV